MTDQQTGAVFSGASPTKPWTDVCIAHRTGQRISGPLFFGFSDPVTQRAIASNLYSPAELAAALHVRCMGACMLGRRRCYPCCDEAAALAVVPTCALAPRTLPCRARRWMPARTRPKRRQPGSFVQWRASERRLPSSWPAPLR